MISVIVPVYKVEPYLDRCIRSIVEQTYTDLEIILVDDGSPDNCPAMCDAWAKKDSRILVIHQLNAGAGAARNAALNIATGEMIAFVDSDDYLSPDMYSHLHSLMAHGADIAECGYANAYDDNMSFDCDNASVHTYTVQEAMAEHIRDRIFRQLIWNKLYRREIIGDIRFPTGKKIDDEFLTYQVLGNAKTLIRSERICYAYRQQQTSIMHVLTAQARLQAMEAKLLRNKYIEENFPDLISLSLNDLWFHAIYQGQMALQHMQPAESNNAIFYLKSILLQHPCSFANCTAKERFWLTLARCSLYETCKLRNALKIGL
ncbi:MAG: glycosyltransferase [Pseudoflavonifractor capillosus]|uniref:glycosyltransferase family 2 protein n=1 Tax=Pseudoflavonifractor capillosus TaxID=106588 RepID=UPI0023F88782|nr:glycosyltransferase [Pseudoflavonifractor capillosus]MCI5927314.1 glycosyltransferase [Pseudoflavonifractor capillosus]MDY4660487.1 glycosyltransferase [Pseudoflavonifractor capillosus]